MNSQLHNLGEGRRAEPVANDLVRPRYAPGLVLEDTDLTAAVDYMRTLTRLLLRSLIGCGVVCGLRVTVKTDGELAVTVDPGLALDGCGDPIQLVKPVTVTLPRTDGVLAERGAAGTAPAPRELWVVLCGGEQSYAKRELVIDADDLDGAAELTRIRGTAQVAVLFKRPKCLCAYVAPAADEGPAAAGASGDYIPDGGCDCGCCVLLARLEWPDSAKEWRAVHEGERRFLRPMLGRDPLKDRESGNAAEQPGTAGTAATQ
jgi:hypothetical protein